MACEFGRTAECENHAGTGLPSIATRAQPVAFDGLAGFVHPAGGDCAVIMCSALGHEQLCASRTWRVLAEQIAQAGFPVLRFDYDGCGDSLGDKHAPDCMAAWQASLTAAAAFARRVFSVRRIVVVGLRFGAILSALKGHQLEVDGLVLLAPPATGRAYARELKAMTQIAGRAQPPDGGGLAVEGFLYSPELLAKLNEADLRKLPALPARKILIVHPDASAGAALQAAFAGLGSACDRIDFEGYRELFFDVTLSKTPDRVIEQTVSWLRANIPIETRPAFPAVDVDKHLLGSHFVEEGIWFGEHGRLFGIHTEPNANEALGLGVIILNTGINAHGGYGRFGTDLARRLALLGVSSFRIDVAGIAESAPLPGRDEPPVYDEALCADVRSAVQWMTTRGHAQVMLLGVCSGAWLALQSALRMPDVGRIMLINLPVYVWKPEYGLQIDQGHEATWSYVDKAMKRTTWLRLARGELDFATLRRAARKAREVVVAQARNAFWKYLGDDNDTKKTRNWMLQLSRRGVVAIVATGDKDMARDELVRHFGYGGRWLGKLKGMHVVSLGAADHTLSTRQSQDLVWEILKSHLTLKPIGRGERGAADRVTVRAG